MKVDRLLVHREFPILNQRFKELKRGIKNKAPSEPREFGTCLHSHPDRPCGSHALTEM